MHRKLPILIVPFRNRGHLFESYFHREGSDGLFVPSETAFQVGERLFLELNFLEEQRSFRIRGTVQWRRLRTGRTALPPGIGVEFDTTERNTRDLILEFCRGREIDFTVRSAHRFPVTIQIGYASDSRFLTDYTDDFSLGGVFILTDQICEVGTILKLKLKPPGYLMGIRLRGVVVWVSRRAARRGLGLKFLLENERKKRQVEKIVESLKMSILKDLQINTPHKGAS